MIQVLELLINQESKSIDKHQSQDFKKLLLEFFNLYIIISINIRLYHFNDISKDIKYIINTLIDNVIERTSSIDNKDTIKLLKLVKEKKEKIEFINVEKLT